MTDGLLIGCLVALALGIVAVLVGSEIYIARVRRQGELNMAPYETGSVAKALESTAEALVTIGRAQESVETLKDLFENMPQEVE